MRLKKLRLDRGENDMTTIKQMAPADRIAQLQKLANDPDAAAELVTEIIESVVDANEEVRNWATEALENLESPRPQDAPKLAAMISNSEDDIAFWALKMLGRLGEAAKSQEKDIARALDSKRGKSVRQNAAWALGKLGGLAADSRAKLEEVLSESDARLVQLAKQALNS